MRYTRQDRADGIPVCKAEELEEGWQTYLLKWLMFKLTGLRVHFHKVNDKLPLLSSRSYICALHVARLQLFPCNNVISEQTIKCQFFYFFDQRHIEFKSFLDSVKWKQTKSSWIHYCQGNLFKLFTKIFSAYRWFIPLGPLLFSNLLDAVSWFHISATCWSSSLKICVKQNRIHSWWTGSEPLNSPKSDESLKNIDRPTRTILHQLWPISLNSFVRNGSADQHPRPAFSSSWGDLRKVCSASTKLFSVPSTDLIFLLQKVFLACRYVTHNAVSIPWVRDVLEPLNMLKEKMGLL